MAKDKELPVEDPKTTETAKELEERPVLVIRVKDDITTCVELATEGYERMQAEIRTCEENTTEKLKSVWVGYNVATSEQVTTYKGQANLTTIFSNE